MYNGFRAVKTLKQVEQDPRVAEIEGEGMDEGRVFIHLKKGWIDPFPECVHSISVGSAADVRDAMRRIVPCNGPCCK